MKKKLRFVNYYKDNVIGGSICSCCGAQCGEDNHTLNPNYNNGIFVNINKVGEEVVGEEAPPHVQMNWNRTGSIKYPLIKDIKHVETRNGTITIETLYVR